MTIKPVFGVSDTRSGIHVVLTIDTSDYDVPATKKDADHTARIREPIGTFTVCILYNAKNRGLHDVAHFISFIVP